MHTNAWASWVGLVMVVALSTTNPYYLGVVLLSVLLVAVMAPKASVTTGVTSFRALLVFGVSMTAISFVVGVVNGNYGSHVLFTIPSADLPGWLGGLRLGGPVTGEGMVATLTRGLAILSVLLAFGVFNGQVSPRRVLRSTPAALFQAGLVVTVGLSLLPSSIEDVRRIREMRALRGAKGGLRELPALVVPAVVGGLERSMRLAEAMEARGYGAAPRGERGPRMAAMASAPLLLVGASAWFYYPSLRMVAGLAALAGAACLVWWLLASARLRTTTSLREEAFPTVDRVLAWGSVAVTVGVLGAAVTGWTGLSYNPFAGLPWPAFRVAVALIPLSVAWPAVRFAFATPTVVAAPLPCPVVEG